MTLCGTMGLPGFTALTSRPQGLTHLLFVRLVRIFVYKLEALKQTDESDGFAFGRDQNKRRRVAACFPDGKTAEAMDPQYGHNGQSDFASRET